MAKKPVTSTDFVCIKEFMPGMSGPSGFLVMIRANGDWYELFRELCGECRTVAETKQEVERKLLMIQQAMIAYHQAMNRDKPSQYFASMEPL